MQAKQLDATPGIRPELWKILHVFAQKSQVSLSSVTSLL